MIELPDFNRAFEYENNFYLSCDPTRIGKILAHYELYKMVSNVPGAIVECGVLKGTSLVRFASFRDLFSNSSSKKKLDLILLLSSLKLNLIKTNIPEINS
ncbi:hypothetical protein [Moorena sp. SIO4E2]|uniref:hypothetical protein n=1 Tax=Moorena sp. SIO4E2 TaxID=2607826 RepID=UPI00257E7BB6|nr:hypothetical protein [Moorena sp. SIO4E2]